MPRRQGSTRAGTGRGASAHARERQRETNNKEMITTHNTIEAKAQGIVHYVPCTCSSTIHMIVLLGCG